MADEQAPKKKKSKLKWIILLFLILLLSGGGAGAWFFFLKDKFGGEGGEVPKKEQQAADAAKVAPPPGVGGPIVPLKTYTTNLADPLGRRFIKISLAVQAADDTVAPMLQAQEARVSDTVIMLLSSKSYADIATPESKEILKSEILSRLNLILGGPKISQVLITDFVIQ